MSVNTSDDFQRLQDALKGRDEFAFLEVKYGIPRSTIDEAIKKVGRDVHKVEEYITTRSE